MFPNMALWLKIVLALVVALVISYLTTPPVKRFAIRVNAIDIPRDDRREHADSIPRMGGLAIFLGFIISMLIFVDMTTPILGMLAGALIIVVMGAIDDIKTLNPWQKLAGQILAAVVAVRSGIVVYLLTNPLTQQSMNIGFLAIPLTILWIVGCTNAVNLIDGLDGLAAGVSTISSLTMMVVALFVSDGNMPLILAALAGACLGFLHYNLNPAEIFMGDTGSQFLGFILSTVSILGLFKLHAFITFLVPVMAMAVPLADTLSAIFRRLSKGQSPFAPDHAHFHHKLIQMGLSHKQAVYVLYGVSALFGLLAIFLAGDIAVVKIICVVAAAVIVLCLWFFIFFRNPNLKKHKNDAQKTDGGESKN